MDNHELNKYLKEKAVELGLCQDWQNQWKQDWSQKKMINKFYEGIDFCLKNNFPSDDFIRSYFPPKILHDNGVYINDAYSGLNHTCSIIKKNSVITLRYNASNVGTVYVTDSSKLNLTAKNRSYIIVHALDDAIVTAQAFDDAKIVVIQHSATASVYSTGNVQMEKEFGWLE